MVVREILRMNEGRPPLLEEWSVSAKATRLIAALHSGSWFRCGGLSVAETRQGGRQCKLGSTIVNVFAEAVVRLQSSVLDEGVARVVCPDRSTPKALTLVQYQSWTT